MFIKSRNTFQNHQFLSLQLTTTTLMFTKQIIVTISNYTEQTYIHFGGKVSVQTKTNYAPTLRELFDDSREP